MQSAPEKSEIELTPDETVPEIAGVVDEYVVPDAGELIVQVMVGLNEALTEGEGEGDGEAVVVANSESAAESFSFIS